MAVVELQMKRQAFLDFFQIEINRQRLPSRTLDNFPGLAGKLLQRIECTGARVDPSGGAGRVTVQADMTFHHNTLAAVRAAGSLSTPVTERLSQTIPISLAVVFDAAGVPAVRWSLFNGVIPGTDIPIRLPGDFTALSGAVEANAEVVAIRLGTRADDPVAGPIIDRTGTGDWVQLVSGQVIADVLLRNFREAIESELSDTLVLDIPPSAAWFPALGNQDPFVGVSATVVAVDECIFEDVPVDLQLIGTLQPSGPSLVTTVELSWDPHSTLCELVGGILFTPIASVVINGIAEDKAAEKILGTVQPFEGFDEISRDDESITFQRHGLLETPAQRFVLDRSEVTDDGLVIGGSLMLQSASRSLQGEATSPSSRLKTDCNRRTVLVEFRHPTVSLRDLGVDGGAPRMLPDGVTFDPPNAWVAVPGSSNTWLDLTLTFVDPPTGRLAVGTATSVYLHTDCGLRWVDLGMIPPDHPPPTTGNIAEMISHCMAISDPWGKGVMNLDWLVDWPDLIQDIEPLRQWTVAARGLPEGAQLEFVALARDGNERPLGTIEGQRNVAAYLITDATETLQIRTEQGLSAPAPTVSQNWFIPFATVPLGGEAVSLASMGRMIGVREAGGSTHVVDFGFDGKLRVRRVEGILRGDPGIRGVLTALSRKERRSHSAVAVPARVDRRIVALTHRGTLLIGNALPAARL